MGRRVLADHVFDALLEMLLDGSFEAGSSLNIDGLSRELEVSPTPVREALARLEATGLVRRVALRGYSVAPAPEAKELADLMDARLAVEPVTAWYAAQRATPELVAELAEALDALDAAPNGPSYQEYREYRMADERFHGLIARGADNAYLEAAYLALGGLVLRFRQFSGVGVYDREHAAVEHRAVFEAIRGGDADRARDLMRKHVEGVRERALANA